MLLNYAAMETCSRTFLDYLPTSSICVEGEEHYIFTSLVSDEFPCCFTYAFKFFVLEYNLNWTQTIQPFNRLGREGKCVLFLSRGISELTSRPTVD